jgi:ATP-binding cassette, subfamily B, bacterial
MMFTWFKKKRTPLRAGESSDSPSQVIAARFPARDRDESDEADKRPLDMGLVRWLFGYTRRHARKRNTLLALVVVRSIQLPMLAWFMGRVIDGPVAHGNSQGLYWGVAAYVALSLATQLVLHFRQRLALELGEAVVHDLRNDLFAHLQRMPMSFFGRTRVGRIISRMTSDAEAVRSGVQDVLFSGMVGAGQMLVATALMLACDPVLFSIIAAMFPVLWFVNQHFRQRLTVAYRAVQESFSRITATVAETIQGVQVIQGAVREATNAERFRELVTEHGENNMKAARAAGVFLPLLEFNTQFFLAALLAVGGYRVFLPGTTASVGDLVQFVFLANIFFGPIQTLGDQYNQAMVSMAGAERLRRLLDTPADWSDAPQVVRLPRVTGAVRFDNVSFGYDPQRLVLERVSFAVEPSQSVALVGHTGSGKTSIINLLAKFYLPTHGRVLVDGRDIRDLDTAWLRRQMGMVGQQNFLFTGTVLDNIRIARPDASEADVRRAAEQLGALDLLESLPRGLHTEVGESGSSLSLGQRQLVCFARAMLADPRILILDEATSSIDVFTEYRLQQALGRLLQGRTSFMVAHRLSTIRSANLVLVLDAGQIVERGTHRQLLAESGVYAALHRRAVA